jgi:hypothetical protein
LDKVFSNAGEDMKFIIAESIAAPFEEVEAKDKKEALLKHLGLKDSDKDYKQIAKDFGLVIVEKTEKVKQ